MSNSGTSGSLPLRIHVKAFCVGAFLSTSVAAFAASQVVTVCGSVDAPGGLNLASAVAVGGEIVIHCPAGQSAIQFSRTLDAKGVVHIDGGSKVTLRGPVAGPLFTADSSLHLSGLILENLRTAATAGSPGAGAIVLGAEASIELDGVTTQNSLGAYAVKTFSARDSSFVSNGDPANRQPFASVVNADSIELLRTKFTNNLDHPIAGGTTPEPGRAALSRSILIADSVFTGNRSTLLLTDAHVTIRNTQFVGNGTPPEKGEGAWDCCGGAITMMRVDADLSNTQFRDNGSAGFGGAILALGSRLRLTDSIFDGNKARVGGAIMFWGRQPKVNVWSTGDWTTPPVLELQRIQFHANSATVFGGGLGFAGQVAGDAVLFQANESGVAGGAIADWRAAELPDPFGGVFGALVDASMPSKPDSLALSRPILVDNVAGSRGAAIAAGDATIAIGNGLIARNRSTAAQGAAINAFNVALVNTTLADNPAGGLITSAGSTVRLGNTILLRNTDFNCKPGGALSDAGRNLQYPGNDCGAAIAQRDAGLDGQYAPGLVSAARGAGDVGLCTTDLQVLGVDLFAHPRLQGGHCDVGAIELPLPQAVAGALGLGSGQNAAPRLVWWLVLLILLLFLLGFLLAVLRRRKRKQDSAKAWVAKA